MTLAFDPVAFLIAVGYAGILAAIWKYRHRIPSQVKPLGPLVIVQASVWVAFYGSIATLDAPPWRMAYIWMSRFGHMLDLVLLGLLILLLVRMGGGDP